MFWETVTTFQNTFVEKLYWFKKTVVTEVNATEMTVNCEITQVDLQSVAMGTQPGCGAVRCPLQAGDCSAGQPVQSATLSTCMAGSGAPCRRGYSVVSLLMSRRWTTSRPWSDSVSDSDS